MDKTTRSKEGQDKQNISRITLMRMIAVSAVVIALLIALSFAWFTNKSNITTLVEVQAPTKISVLGPHGEAQAFVDMSYTDDDVVEDENGNKKVTIKRVISISSDTTKHQLEIVHTTNLKNLTFKVYKAKETESGSVTAGDYKYSYDQGKDIIAGNYINLEKTENDYKFADSSEHSFNFEDYTSVQAHAEPVYWLSGKVDSDELTSTNENVKTKYLTYYVLEISWEDPAKETDMFYVLAHNN